MRIHFLFLSFLTAWHIESIYLFDTNKVAEDEKYPLDYRGMLASGNPLMYPNLVSPTGYRWRECRFRNSTLSEVESPNPNLHEAVVRQTFEVIIG